ncbi:MULTISPECIES: O-antigen ligase family protein [unclassified Brevundimonas]|uniref:O-antigen ligase family protein n=1 Tax=unclassified Brevundimonas TaxID=2622653 RepID=UPI003F924C82
MTRATPYADILAFLASVLVVLIYSQSWAAPMTGYGARSADFLRNGYYPAYVLAVGLVLIRPGAALKALARSPLMILLLALTAASVLWSINPDVTLRRVLALLFTTLGGVALASRWRWATLAEIFATAMAVMMVASLFLGALMPEWGRMQEIFPGAWRGLWLEKNALGENMGLAALFMTAAAIMVPARRRLWLALAVIAAVLVILSTSKTGLVVLILSFASMGFVALVQAGPKRAIVGTWLAVVAVCAALLVIVTRSDLIFDLLGKDATLTGRTEIWGGILHQMQQRPWTGFGYGVVWDDTSPGGPNAWIAHEAKFTAAHAHSGWLEVYLALGIPGVVLLGAWMVEMWGRSLWAAYARPSGWLLMPMMTAYTLTMLTESITMNWHNLRWVLFVALALKAVIGDQDAPARVVPVSSRVRRPRPF